MAKSGNRASLKHSWAPALEGSNPSPGTSDDVTLADEISAFEPLEAEAGDVHGRRRALNDQLRDQLADHRGVLEAMAAEAVREVEPRNPRRLADDRMAVGSHLVQPDPSMLHRRRFERWEDPDRR